jgi:hypothetical protein
MLIRSIWGRSDRASSRHFLVPLCDGHLDSLLHLSGVIHQERVCSGSLDWRIGVPPSRDSGPADGVGSLGLVAGIGVLYVIASIGGLHIPKGDKPSHILVNTVREHLL